MSPGRKKHVWARAAALCLLLVLVIAASALLFSGDDALVPPDASSASERFDEDYREYFSSYYDSSESSGAFSCELPRVRADGLTLELTPRPEGEAMTLAGLYEACAPSIVAITCTVDDGAKYVWGSGIIMTGDGYILTNAHVLEGAESCTVTLWDDREYPASLVGADSPSDLGIIKIDAVGLSAAQFCAGGVTVGEQAAAIGNPLGPELRGTMTDGIISALSRDITYTNHPMTLIQTNVAINNGSSGGALFNMYGQVVGVTSMKLVSVYAGSSIEGLSFAIPVDTVKEVSDALFADGKVLGRPALGITVGAIPLAAAEHYGIPAGLYVSAVSPGSDAEAQGVQPGDILVSVDGEQVSEVSQLSEIIDAKEVGGYVTLELYRYGGDMAYLNVTLMETADLY